MLYGNYWWLEKLWCYKYYSVILTYSVLTSKLISLILFCRYLLNEQLYKIPKIIVLLI